MNSIRGRLKTLSIAIAMCLALSVAVGSASAAVTYTVSHSNGWVTIVGAGSAATNYTIHVQHPYSLGLDADYWNMTIYCDHTGTDTTHGAYYVHVHIYDGSTNLTKNCSITALDDARVYSNVSHAAAAYAGLVKNDSAKYTVELYLSTGVLKAAYVGEVDIMTTELASGMVNAIMIIIPMIVLVMIIGWIGGLTGKIGGKSRGGT